VGVVLLAGAITAAGAELTALPTGGEGWFGNPLVWRFRPEQVECATTNGHGIAVYEAAPLAAHVTVEALFTPQKAQSLGWDVAAVAIVADPDNFWHLALVQMPPENGLRPMVELCEMRDGEWLAQHNLKMEINEAPAVPWTFGQPHRLTLSWIGKGSPARSLRRTDDCPRRAFPSRLTQSDPDVARCACSDRRGLQRRALGVVTTRD
jgi:hypothetical protein